MPTILCVDDEPTQLTLLEFAFKRAGFRVLCAADGAEAVKLAKAHKPDLILMDLMMPVLDGAKATAKIKAYPATASIPVLLFTAYEKGTLAKTAMEAGALEIIPKTTTPSALVKKIKTLVNL